MSKQIYAQASLFRRQKLAENTISYTPGPNPDLGCFVEEHATPYNPATDDYNVPPFDKPITSTKATAIYNMHTYWSKKPHDAIRQYIRHYTQLGDLVLDPFCGSGGTALAALMEGRVALAIDLSPAATFITKNYCTLVDVAALEQAFAELQARVQPEMDWLYATRCDRCDGKATTAYTVYSYVFQCPRCLEKVTLFDCVEAEGGTAKGKPKKINACPHCFTRGHVEEISTRSERFAAVPVLVSYLCQEGCKPQRGERRHNDANEKKRDFFARYDLAKLAEIEAREIPYWTPPERMMNAPEDQERWGMLFRSGVAAFQKVTDVYTPRNLYALASLLNLAEPDSTMRFVIHSILLNASRMYRHRTTGGGGPAGNISVAQVHREMNVSQLLESKVGDMKRGFLELSFEVFNEQPKVIISTQSSTNIEVPQNSIDYIFTDPPYGDKFPYGELNFIWEAWMGFRPQWHEQEIIVNPVQGKTENDWASLMKKVVQECFRVLKPGRWLSLCYHDTSEGTWQLVQDIMAEAGFISETSETSLYIDTGQKSFKQLIAEKVTKRDLVINFRKPRHDELPQPLTLSGDEDAATFTQKAMAILRETLEAHPGSLADRLYDELVSRLVRQGSFERHNFDDLLRRVAEPVDGRWYLLETADQPDAAESAKEETAAARLEAFMQAHLSENPDETGIHFSDLFEQNLYVQDKPRRVLKEWLPEFFFRTEAGTWRPPANKEEREQKAALRSTGTLRRIKRFGNALLEGVPPAERDRPENVATAGGWIRQCRRAGLYELGRALYEKGGFNFADLGDEDMLGVEEDYQICVRRS
ncbi:MAG: site-specific DNA-methyltransferase [Chloroflexi bacterium]|nr:site-specific DNA-methyltransferase [Chloroflexota bacterium]